MPAYSFNHAVIYWSLALSTFGSTTFAAEPSYFFTLAICDGEPEFVLPDTEAPMVDIRSNPERPEVSGRPAWLAPNCGFLLNGDLIGNEAFSDDPDTQPTTSVPLGPVLLHYMAFRLHRRNQPYSLTEVLNSSLVSYADADSSRSIEAGEELALPVFGPGDLSWIIDLDDPEGIFGLQADFQADAKRAGDPGSSLVLARIVAGPLDGWTINYVGLKVFGEN